MLLKNELPTTDDEKGISRIRNWVTSQIRDAVTWIDTEDGQILGNALKSLGSFVIGDTTDIVIPYLFDLSVSTLRRRFLPDLKDLADRLYENKDRINESFQKSDVGQEILKETIRELIRQNDKEKRELHKQFLINAYTKKDKKQERISAFMNILISLEPIQLHVLSALCTPEKTVMEILKKRDRTQSTFPVALKNDVERLLEIDDEIFERSINKLESENIISRKEGLEIQWCTGEYQSHHESNAITRMVDTLKRLVTPFGRDFVSYFIEIQ